MRTNRQANKRNHIRKGEKEKNDDNDTICLIHDLESLEKCQVLQSIIN